MGRRCIGTFGFPVFASRVLIPVKTVVPVETHRDGREAAAAMATIWPATPQLDKMKAVQKESQLLGEFLEWLQEEGLVICEWHENQYVNGKLSQPAGVYPTRRTSQQLLADYFGIDLKAADWERQALLDALRCAEEATTAHLARRGNN